MIETREVSKEGIRTTNLETWHFERRRIFLCGEITDETAYLICRQLYCLDHLSKDEITMVINSPGGSVSAGLSILDAMRRSRSPIRTEAEGVAASMAAILLAWGEKGRRMVSPNAEIMIHQVLGGISGQATEIEHAAQRILKIRIKLNEYLAAATGKSVEEIAEITERDHFFTAEEAICYGLADKIY